MRPVKPPAPTKCDMLTWSSDELRMFLAAIEGARLEIGFRIAAATGLRRGEVLGLRWRDVDFDLGQIAVAHTITRAGKELVMGPPKTPRSRRNVYLDTPELAPHAARHRRGGAGRSGSTTVQPSTTPPGMSSSP